jgi:nitrate reductase gamma subunit
LNSLITFFYTFFVEKLPYITIAIFLLGAALRATRWMSAPKDPEKSQISVTAAVKYIILDVVFFRKTFKSDKVIWLIIFLFHIAAGGILFGHMRGFHIWSAEMFAPLGEWVAEFMVETLPVYMGWLFIATQILLLIRRVLLEDRRLASLPNDYLALILLLITSILGQGMRIFPPEAIPTHTYSVVFIPGLIVLHLEKVPSFHWFFLHILFTQLFIMYIPFSKLVHIFSGVITSALYGSRRSEYGL